MKIHEVMFCLFVFFSFNDKDVRDTKNTNKQQQQQNCDPWQAVFTSDASEMCH